MWEMLESFIATIQQNPIAYSIFGVGILGSLSYWCKSIPLWIWRTFIDRITISVEITNTPASPDIVTIFEQEFHAAATIKSFTKNFQLGKNKDDELYLMIGTHRLCVIKVCGIWCSIWKYEHEKPDMYGVRHYTYRLRFFTRKTSRVESYIRDVYLRALSDPTGNYIIIHTKPEWSHCDFNKIKKKKLICPAASQRHRDIIEAIKRAFDDDKILIKEKLGVLLYGTPGCGKSKLIFQLASELGFNIYVVNLKDFRNDAEFLTSLNRVRMPGIIVFEDIDCVVNSREAFNDAKDKDKNTLTSGVTLSTLLNVFDGLLTMEGQFVIATTNYRDRLDPALIRTGRFDMRYELFPLNRQEIIEFIMQYYNVDSYHVNDILPIEISSMTIADLDYICRSYSIKELTSQEWIRDMLAASNRNDFEEKLPPSLKRSSIREQQAAKVLTLFDTDKNRTIDRKDIELLLSCKRQSANNLLNYMCDAQLLIKEGVSYGTTYRLFE